MSMRRRARRLSLALVSTTLGALLAAAPAPAATVSSPNTCRNSVNNLYFDLPVSLTSSSAITPDARYPTPSEVVGGQTITTAAGTAGVVLPEFLARFGYNLGLLGAGSNSVSARVWLVVEGTNTRERTQLVGPVDVTATTTITVDPADDNRFLAATPFAFSDPPVQQMTWTSVGGDAAFRQAGAGVLPALPVGPGGTLRSIGGSAVIHLTFASGASIFLDCQPGVTTNIQFDFMGPTFTPATAIAFDTEAGPQNLMCLNDLGRQVTGAATNFPAGVDRELDPLRGSVSAIGYTPEFTPGAAYTLTGAGARAVLSADTVATLGRFSDGGGSLVAPGASYALSMWVAIAATNTVEGVQTVRVDGAWSPDPAATPITPMTPWLPEDVTLALPSTTWTPTGAGPIEFRLAAPGLMAPISLVGPAGGGPGGTVVTTPYTATPYGSLVLRVGTARNASTLDCAAGAVRIANAGIAWSNLGRVAPPTGSAGRYVVDANAGVAPFARVTAGASAPPADPPATPPAGPPVTPPVEPPADPPAKPRTVGAGRVASASLKLANGRTRVTITCARTNASCRGVLRVQTAVKVRLGKRLRIVSMAKAASYSLAAGKSRVLTLPLSADGKALFKARRSVRVVISLRPAKGGAVNRTVTLSR